MSEQDLPEPRLRQVVRELQSETSRDPAAEERTIARVRQEAARSRPSHGPVHRSSWWNWFLRSRRVSISPLGATLFGAGAVLLIVAASSLVSRDPRVSHLAAGEAEPGSRPVLFTVVAPGARSVTVAGDFNDWDPEANPLDRRGQDGIWAGVVMLPAGVYKYAYVVDGRIEVADDHRPAMQADEFGIGSSVVVVTQERI